MREERTPTRHLQAARSEWWSLAIAAAVAAAIGLLAPWEPDRVSVTIDNPTDHRLYIHPTTPTDDNQSFVLIVSPHSTATARHVIDRGEQWVLHLRTPGSSAGTITASRDELTDGSFAVPMTINEHLTLAGVPADTDDFLSRSVASGGD